MNKSKKSTSPVRHGKWIAEMSIMEDFIQGAKMYYCSCCGHEMMMTKEAKRKINYCSNCGAKMDKLEKEDEYE